MMISCKSTEQAHIERVQSEDVSAVYDRAASIEGGQNAFYEMLSYPRSALLDRRDGRVLLIVDVNTDGLADEIRIHEGSGYADFDRNAVQAMQQMRFIPAVENGELVDSEMLFPVVFRHADQ
ncbi:MAG: energy transducer TonB [Balneolia bacterium]|nr:energy transducer TonB [Balneolia bacterium]